MTSNVPLPLYAYVSAAARQSGASEAPCRAKALQGRLAMHTHAGPRGGHPLPEARKVGDHPAAPAFVARQPP